MSKLDRKEIIIAGQTSVRLTYATFCFRVAVWEDSVTPNEPILPNESHRRNDGLHERLLAFI